MRLALVRIFYFDIDAFVPAAFHAGHHTRFFTAAERLAELYRSDQLTAIMQVYGKADACNQIQHQQ